MIRGVLSAFALLILPGLAAAQAVSPPPPDAAILFEVRIGELVDQLRAAEGRADARKQLAALGKDATPQLLAHLDDEDATVRWEIVSLLGASADARGAAKVCELAVKDPNPHVRWRSLWALSRFEDARDDVLATLRKSYASEDASEQWNAAIALSFFGAPDVVPTLNAGVRSPDGFKRWEAINALGRVHDGGSVKALVPALKSPSARDRAEAALSLGHIGGAEATALLVAALSDPQEDVRWRVCLALSAAGGPNEIPHLKKVAETDSSERVKSQARKAIEKIERARTAQ